MIKSSARKRLKAALGALTTEVRAGYSQIIQERVLKSSLFKAARSVLLYAPIQAEVDTALLQEHSLSSGKSLYYPTVTVPNALVFRRVNSTTAFITNHWGIREPGPDCPVLPLPAHHCLVIVPGLGFSPDKQRLGRGGGYYDRFLPTLSTWGAENYLVGLCFKVQVLENIVFNAGDIKMDFLVTEEDFL